MANKYPIDILKDEDGNVIRPATITDNVVNPATKKSVTEELSSLAQKINCTTFVDGCPCLKELYILDGYYSVVRNLHSTYYSAKNMYFTNENGEYSAILQSTQHEGLYNIVPLYDSGLYGYAIIDFDEMAEDKTVLKPINECAKYLSFSPSINNLIKKEENNDEIIFDGLKKASWDLSKLSLDNFSSPVGGGYWANDTLYKAGFVESISINCINNCIVNVAFLNTQGKCIYKKTYNDVLSGIHNLTINATICEDFYIAIDSVSSLGFAVIDYGTSFVNVEKALMLTALLI